MFSMDSIFRSPIEIGLNTEEEEEEDEDEEEKTRYLKMLTNHLHKKQGSYSFFCCVHKLKHKSLHFQSQILCLYLLLLHCPI